MIQRSSSNRRRGHSPSSSAASPDLPLAVSGPPLNSPAACVAPPSIRPLDRGSRRHRPSARPRCGPRDRHGQCGSVRPEGTASGVKARFRGGRAHDLSSSPGYSRGVNHRADRAGAGSLAGGSRRHGRSSRVRHLRRQVAQHRSRMGHRSGDLSDAGRSAPAITITRRSTGLSRRGPQNVIRQRVRSIPIILRWHPDDSQAHTPFLRPRHGT